MSDSFDVAVDRLYCALSSAEEFNDFLHTMRIPTDGHQNRADLIVLLSQMLVSELSAGPNESLSMHMQR